MGKESRNVIGRNLRRIRKLHGLSQQGLAALAGKTQDTVSRIEIGGRDPHPTTLHDLAEALGVEVADFFREPETTQAGRPRSLKKFLMDRCGHSLFTDLPLEEIGHVDETTRSLLDMELTEILIEQKKHPRGIWENLFDVPRKEIVRYHSTVTTAYLMGRPVVDAVNLMRRDIAEGFEPHQGGDDAALRA